MPLMVLGLIVATALLILAVTLVSPHRQRKRRAADGDCSGDTSWMVASFGDGGGSDCGSGDGGGGD